MEIRVTLFFRTVGLRRTTHKHPFCSDFPSFLSTTLSFFYWLWFCSFKTNVIFLCRIHKNVGYICVFFSVLTNFYFYICLTGVFLYLYKVWGVILYFYKSSQSVVCLTCLNPFESLSHKAQSSVADCVLQIFKTFIFIFVLSLIYFVTWLSSVSILCLFVGSGSFLKCCL